MSFLSCMFCSPTGRVAPSDGKKDDDPWNLLLLPNCLLRLRVWLMEPHEIINLSLNSARFRARMAQLNYQGVERLGVGYSSNHLLLHDPNFFCPSFKFADESSTILDKKMRYHANLISEIFSLPVTDICFNPQNFETNYNWLKSRQNSIDKVKIQGSATKEEAEEIWNKILTGGLKINRELQVGFEKIPGLSLKISLEKFALFENFIGSLKILNPIRITPMALASLKCWEINISDSSLTDHEINSLLVAWKNGDLPNWKYLGYLDIHRNLEDVNNDEILEGLDPIKLDETKPRFTSGGSELKAGGHYIAQKNGGLSILYFSDYLSEAKPHRVSLITSISEKKNPHEHNFLLERDEIWDGIMHGNTDDEIKLPRMEDFGLG